MRAVRDTGEARVPRTMNLAVCTHGLSPSDNIAICADCAPKETAMPDNAPRLLRDVLAEVSRRYSPAAFHGFASYADDDCKRLGLAGASVVPDLAAHDAEVREAIRGDIEREVRIALRPIQNNESDVVAFAFRVATAILGLAPNAAPLAHEGDSR